MSISCSGFQASAYRKPFRRRKALWLGPPPFAFFLTLLLLLTIAESRGSKRNIPPDPNAPQDPCQARGLDCSSTCCQVNVCAPVLNEDNCAGYIKRPYVELYIGFGAVFALIIGTPIIVSIINCLVLTKFCKKYDELSDTYWGGYSVTDCLSKLCPCFCYRVQDYERGVKHHHTSHVQKQIHH